MGGSPDVLVVGGGIIGLTSALYLAKAGMSVEVVDKGELGREASWAGAGIIPPGNPARAATPADKLRAIGSLKFPALSEVLRAETGIDNGYRRCGGVELLTADDSHAVDLWRAEDLAFHDAGGDVLVQIEPRVRLPDGATPYRFPHGAQVRNPWHLRAVAEACRGAGVRLTPAREVFQLYPLNDGTVGCLIMSDGTAGGVQYPVAGRYLVTAGAWAGRLLSPLGWDKGIHPVRGQIVLFNPGRRLFSHVLTAGKRYLVPRDDGRVLAGATEEPEAGFDTANTPGGVEGLIEFACSLVPALRDAPIEKAWAGLRPGSPDGLPFIGPVPGYSNLFAAVGHGRAGIQQSIGTAELVRDLILGRPPAVSAAAFRLDRPPGAAARPAFRS